jgi:predicted GIY-YIG superfamily endonuclease
MSDGLHCLYRFWNDDTLLYVGISCDPGRRFGEHRQDKPWWTQVDKITLEQHPTRHAVLVAERQAIVLERPLYNLDAGADVAIPAEMPDQCFDFCNDGAVYWPVRWRDGIAKYVCHAGHHWRCWWSHPENGDAPENAGTP